MMVRTTRHFATHVVVTGAKVGEWVFLEDCFTDPDIFRLLSAFHHSIFKFGAEQRHSRGSSSKPWFGGGCARCHIVHSQRHDRGCEV